MKWFSSTKEVETAYHDGKYSIWVRRLPDYSKRDYLSNWFWNKTDCSMLNLFAPIYTPNAIKWIGSTFRAFSILRTRFYFAKRIETHDEKRRLSYQNKKRRNDAWGSLCNATFDVVGWWIQFSIRIQYSYWTYNRTRTVQPPPVIKHLKHPLCGLFFVPRLYDYHPKSIPAL
jgi:homogentisate 1,2-dioxygenase